MVWLTEEGREKLRRTRERTSGGVERSGDIPEPMKDAEAI